jgi:lysophospholipase L1-like esterase
MDENSVPLKTRKILCLGDSFTFGLGADKGYSYPEQLGKLLDKQFGRGIFTVLNGGIPGCTSSIVSKHLQEFINKFHPEAVIVMAGLNDRDWIEETNYYQFQKGIKSYLFKTDSILSRLRIYKVAKWFLINTYYKFDYPRTAAAVKLMPLNDKDKIEYDKYMAEAEQYFSKKDPKAIYAFKKAIQLNPGDDYPHVRLAEAYKYNLRDYKTAVEEFNIALQINPHNTFCLKSLWQTYYWMGENRLAANTLKRYTMLVPEDREIYGSAFFGVLPSKDDDEAYRKMIFFNLQNIVGIANKNNVKIYLMKYPFHNPDLEQLSVIVQNKPGKAALIDNASVFDALAMQAGYKRNDYFLEHDDHCNNKGYSIIADKVFKALLNDIQPKK